MRKLFSLFLALVATTSLWAHDFEVDGIYYYYLDGNNVKVTYWGSHYGSYDNEYSGEVAIPSTVRYKSATYRVTSIGRNAFRDCSSLTSITIPNSVTSIGDEAFYGCSSLTSIIVEDANSTYDSRDNCNAIIETATNTLIVGCQNTIIPNSVTSIGIYAFRGCSSLTSITIPNSVTSIGHDAFEGCSGLTSITIPNSVTSIGHDAFEGCSGLTSIVWNAKNCANFSSNSNSPFYIIRSQITSFTFGDSVQLIPAYLCYEMSNLITITIPNSVTSIGSSAFSGCSGLTSITIPNSVTSIGSSAFSGCSGLTSITIPNSVTSIGSSAFSGCSGLTSVTIPNSVTSIGEDAFRNCSGLTSITIPNSVTSIGSSVFYGCSGLTSVVWNAENCADFSYSTDAPFYDVRSQITSFTFGDSVQLIPAYLCYEMSNLTTITIPNSVTSIGDGAFEDCSSLTSITIPNSVTSIGNYAFRGCSSLTSVTIPNSVTTVGGGMFYGCSKLKSVVLSNNITSLPSYNADYGFFEKCSSLTSVTIPISVTSIGNYAFYGCSSLTSITIPNSVTTIKERTFYDCSSLTSATIPNSVTSIGWYAFYGCSSLTSVTIPNSVTYIGDHAFRGCSSLTSIIIPENITNIGTGVFVSCASLTSVVWNVKNCVDFFTGSDAEIGTSSTLFYENIRMPSDNGPISSTTVCPITSVVFGDEVESIPAYLCYGLERLTSITIPNSVTSIGNDAFDGCSSLPVENNLRYADTYLVGAVDKTLSTYSIKEGTKWIGDEAFQWCSSLTSITIPNSVTSIGDEAFQWCSSLTSITIPNSVTSIGDEAFYDCESLATITIPNSLTSIGDKAFAYCSSLTSVTIPNSVTSIGDNAFYDCNIDSIILSASDIATFCQGNTNDLLRQQDITFPRKLLIKDVETKEVDIPNSVESIKPSAFYNCIDLNKVSLSNSVKTIGNSAFAGCTGLNLLRLGTGIQSIAANAFAACTKLYDIYCLAAEPPTGYTSSFANYNAFLHVPCESQRLYMLDILFGEFKYIECIASDEVPTDDIVITPGSTDVTITWPTEGNADTYTIVIKKDGEVVCTLTFNADGQLLNIAFAPGRDGNHPAQYAEAVANGGYRFTVTGLTESTDYTYNITVKDASNKTIKSHSGKFTTESLTAVENTHSQSPMTDCQKILRDGQLLILRDGVEYNAMGQEL